MRSILLLLLWWATASAAFRCDIADDQLTADGRLRKQLLCNYDTSVKPVRNASHVVEVYVQMLVKAFNFNDRSNTLDIADWLHISWPDEFLTWQPAQYDNIAELYESSANIWQPDLALFNSEVVTIESEFCKATSCKIDSAGTVECVPPCQHTAHCQSDYRRWPFDTQQCTFSMGTWLQHGAEVNFKLGDSQVEPAAEQSQNREWRMREAWYQYQEGRYSANLSFPSVVFGFALERHARTPALLMLTPALVLVLINLVTLWLSPACLERLALVGLNVYFHFLYLQQLAWYLPKNGDLVPCVVNFFESSLWMTAALLVLAIVARGLHQRRAGAAVAPTWLSAAVAYVAASRVGRVCLRQNYLVERQPLHGVSFGGGGEDGLDIEDGGVHDDSADTANVATTAGGESTAEESTKAVRPSSWRLVVRVCDRCLFVAFLVMYALMVYEWLPEGYLTDQRPAGSVKIHKKD